MIQPFQQTHNVDDNGNPTGGVTTGTGLTIKWQNGPLLTDRGRADPNGAFVETVIAAAIGRLEHYQASKFKCHENQMALGFLHAALEHLNARTANRQARGVEGTHNV